LKASRRGYLSAKLDDPSFTAPIYANLVEDGETFALIRSRSCKQRTVTEFGRQQVPAYHASIARSATKAERSRRVTDEQPIMDDTAAIGGAADIGGLAAHGQDSRI
jgi:hypothetical protein